MTMSGPERTLDAALLEAKMHRDQKIGQWLDVIRDAVGKALVAHPHAERVECRPSYWNNGSDGKMYGDRYLEEDLLDEVVSALRRDGWTVEVSKRGWLLKRTWLRLSGWQRREVSPPADTYRQPPEICPACGQRTPRHTSD